MIKLGFLNNLINTLRWSGKRMIVPESVSDHVWGMISLAIEFHEGLNNKLFINLKDLIYYIALHDVGESLYCDIPRTFKYYSPELHKLIDDTEKELISKKFSKELSDDINGAKTIDYYIGHLVQYFDTIQAGLKMKSEIKLGNTYFISEITNSIDALKYYASEVENNLNLKYEKEYRDQLLEYLNNYIEYLSDY